MRRNNFNIIILVVIFTLFSTVLLSDLSIANGDSNNGIAICNANGDQQLPQICSDGMGGVFITWIDLRSDITYYDIYAQRIDSNGNTQWISNGLAICTYNESQSHPKICPDGNGGAIITWIDLRSEVTGWDIYSQKIDSNGNTQWIPNGVAICTIDGDQTDPQICIDGDGGAIITWYDRRSGASGYDIYAQRIDSNGNVLWTPNGTEICTANNFQRDLQICSNGSGGAVITWEDERTGADIYAQNINIDGIVQWADNGTAICDIGGFQSDPQLCADGVGGVIITWRDDRSGVNVYAQRVYSNGSVWWATNGVAICSASGTRDLPQICSDGAEGGIISWIDRRGFPEVDIYAQKIDSDGIVQWVTDGIGICTAADIQTDSHICDDGGGGAIITWVDQRSGSNLDIYAQRINSTGTIQWVSNGMAICIATDDQTNPQICSDEAGGAFITWEDERSGFLDIYAQRVDSTGNKLWGGNGTTAVPFGNYYIVFILISVISLIVVIRRRYSTDLWNKINH